MFLERLSTLGGMQIMNKSSLVVCALVFVAACVSCQQYGMAAEYTATAYFKVKLRAPTIIARAERDFSEKEYAIFKKTQPYFMKLRYVLAIVLRKPEITNIPDVKREMQEGDPIRWLDKQIRVSFPGRWQLMKVSCTRNDPEEARTLLQAVVDTYMAEIVEDERDSKKERLNELEKSCMSLEVELRKKKEVFIQLTSDIPDENEKAKPFRTTVDIQMLQLDMKTLEKAIDLLKMEMIRQKIELRARPRITQLGPIEKPLMPD